MKNKKNFKVLFLIISSVFIFANSYNFSQAVDVCAEGMIREGFELGKCQSSDDGCQEGYTSLIPTSSACQSNWFDRMCCIEIGSLKKNYEYAYADYYKLKDAGLLGTNSYNEDNHCDANRGVCVDSENTNGCFVIDGSCVAGKTCCSVVISANSGNANINSNNSTDPAPAPASDPDPDPNPNSTPSSTQSTYDSCIDNNGTCQTWCSDGYKELRVGSVFCKTNTFQTTCCIPDTSAPATDDSMTSCTSLDGKRKGNCEFGACSEGLDPTPIESDDCWLWRNCCGLAVSSKNPTATGVSNLSQNTGTSNEVYRRPSLIKCGQNDAGLCYDKNSGGCPLNVFETEDVQNECGTSYVCCLSDTSRKCGSRGGICVDERTICINEDKTNSSNCETGEKCCLENIPYDESKDENEITVAANKPVAYDSQCNSGNQGCKHDNDPAILTNQCKNLLATSNCSSMQAYLDALADQCIRTKAPGFNCNLISSNGFYGNEAKRFADYFIQNRNTPTNQDTSPTATSGAGGLDFDSIAAMGLPDSPGVKSVLVNVVKWMLEIIGLLTFIAFIISGGQYLMSAGDDTAMQKAKKNMTYSIIGIIVALSGFVIVRAIDTALRATSSMF